MSRLQAVQCCSGQAGAGAVADREGLWSDRCSIGSRRVTFIRRLGPRPEAGDEIEHRASPARKARITGTLTIGRSEEHTSELQSLMRISYAVFCLKKKKTNHTTTTN